MKVHYFMTYLSKPEEDTKRDEAFWACVKIKQWIKGGEIKGYFSVDFKGQRREFYQKDKAEFFDVIWEIMAIKAVEVVHGEFDIVPIPGHAVTGIGSSDFSNMTYAEAIAAKTDGAGRAVHCLHWEAVQEPQRGTSRHRRWRERYERLRVGLTPVRPVVLFDDVLTSGSTLIAAKKRLEDAGVQVVGALVLTKAVHDGPATIEWREIDIEERDLLDFFDGLDSCDF